jgi:hypothetical protein
VSLRKRLRTLFVCLVLEFGVLSGVPMQAKQLDELMQMLRAFHPQYGCDCAIWPRAFEKHVDHVCTTAPRRQQ